MGAASPFKAVLPALALGAVGAASVGTLIRGVASPKAQLFCSSVFRGPGRRRSVALTFDDGPSRGSVSLAEWLESRSIQATFFQCGLNVERSPEIARRLQDAGHQIGNHSYSHRRLCPRVGWRWNVRTRVDVFREFAMTQEAIIRATGVAPSVMRAPYGLRWAGMGAAQRRLGLLDVHWTAIAQDWAWNPERVLQHLLERVEPGAILCLHDGRDTRPDPDISVTLRAVQELVPRLQDLGYTFETVAGILRP